MAIPTAGVLYSVYQSCTATISYSSTMTTNPRPSDLIPHTTHKWRFTVPSSNCMVNTLLSAEGEHVTTIPFHTPVTFEGPFLTFVGIVNDIVQVQKTQVVVEISMVLYNALLVMVVPRSQIPKQVVDSDPALFELWNQRKTMTDSMNSIYFRGMFSFQVCTPLAKLSTDIQFIRPIQAMMLTHLVSPYLADWGISRGIESWGYVMNGQSSQVASTIFSMDQQITMTLLRHNLVCHVDYVHFAMIN